MSGSKTKNSKTKTKSSLTKSSKTRNKKLETKTSKTKTSETKSSETVLESLKKTDLTQDFLFSNDKDDIKEEEKIDDTNLSRYIMDFSFSLETRLEALNMYYLKEGGDNTIEILNKIVMLYELSGTRSIRQFLYSICMNSKIEPFLKSIVSKALWSFDKTDDYGYKCVEFVYPLLDKTIGTPYKIDFVKILMCNDQYKQKAKEYFISIISDSSINIDYRYKTILSLEKNEDEEEKRDFSYFRKEACLAFVNNKENTIRYRILASQNLLSMTLTDTEKEEIEKTLLSFAEDEKVDYNERADATDVLLQSASENTKQKAREIIMVLGAGKRKIVSIYDNAQNVHTKEIEESVKEALEFLQGICLMKVKGNPITFEYVENEILKMVEKTDVEEKIKVSLNRIFMDRALYSKYNCSLSHILLQVWTYLSNHKSEDAIKARLLEELCDMAGTCSSGYATRLINTLSGFGDFSYRISWRDQIISNLSGRLNALIRNMDNLRLQEKVLEEMTIASREYELRKNFLKFFRKNITQIRQEMYGEFKEHLNDTDFDLYFRNAISIYENGEF